MDRVTRTTNIIKAYYLYKRNQDASAFIKAVCGFFDFIKNEPISEDDLNFLLFLANVVGIPQYFDLLKDKYISCNISDENIKTITLGSLLHDVSLISGSSKLHRYQKNVVNNFKRGKQNRFVLTAPTSFGKTFLVYEIIKNMQYQNILLIFPAISLLSENYVYLSELEIFKNYKIHSLSEEKFLLSENNIFIFTPERFLSFMDLHQDLHFDFAFIDEIYKIDNSFIIDKETIGENERDISYRLALEFICSFTKDMLLAGPYIEFSQYEKEQNQSFDNFAKENKFSFLRYNQFEIVLKDYITLKDKQFYLIDNKEIKIGHLSKVDKIASILNSLCSPKENSIIYCATRTKTESYAKLLLHNPKIISLIRTSWSEKKNELYDIFLKHLENTFGDDWIVFQALKSRIGIHHGLIPKYIQKEIINLFNKGILVCLFSTTTITEGVNTSAKSIIITSNKKGNKELRQFDAKNIAGRAGRFRQHYSGRVIDLNNNFEEIVNREPEVLLHKNYDIDTIKTDIDYQITSDKYLSDKDLEKKEDINRQIEAINIPLQIFNCFRVIGPFDKLKLYDRISKMSQSSISHIKEMSKFLVQNNVHVLHWNAFQEIMEIILPIVKEEKLRELINTRSGEKNFSLITILLNSYLTSGFIGMVNYWVTRDGCKNKIITKDEAMRKVANYVYNVFKYLLVKYLGIFDLFFRFYISQSENINMDSVGGLGLLLQKLEYNAITPKARKVSDYGVPFKLIDCYDSKEPYDTSRFDAYERHIYQEIGKLFK